MCGPDHHDRAVHLRPQVGRPVLALQAHGDGTAGHTDNSASYVELAALEGADPLRLPGEDDDRDAANDDDDVDNGASRGSGAINLGDDSPILSR